MIDVNKNKDGKYRLCPDNLPEKNRVDLDFWKLDTDDQAILINGPLNPPKKMSDEEAQILWTIHMRVCTKQALTSGLSAEEKADMLL